MFFSPYTPFGGGFSPYQSMMGGGFYGRPAGFSPFGGGIATLSPHAQAADPRNDPRSGRFAPANDPRRSRAYQGPNPLPSLGHSAPPSPFDPARLQRLQEEQRMLSGQPEARPALKTNQEALMGNMHPNDRARFDKLPEDEQQKYFEGANQSQVGGFSRPPMRGGIGSFLPPPMMGGYGSPMMGGFGHPMMGGFGHPMMGGYGSPMMGGFGSPMMGGFGRPMMGGLGGQQVGFSRLPGQYQRLQSTGPYQRHQSV